MEPGTLSQITGAMMLAGSLLLVYLKRIDLARAVGDSGMNGEVLQAEVAKIISVKTGTPALGLFAIGLLLELVPAIVPRSGHENVEYRVKGTVRVRGQEDEKSNIDVYRHFPPLKTTEAGSLPDDLRVSREGTVFPRISLLSPTVSPRDVDLNDAGLVTYDHENRVILIRDPIELSPRP